MAQWSGIDDHALSRRRLVIAALALTGLAPVATRADTTPGPSETLRAFHGVLLSVMQNARQARPQGPLSEARAGRAA
ncbi:MAG: hypothetical protein WDO24_03680 [Pseudomonadota bacterium]